VSLYLARRLYSDCQQYPYHVGSGRYAVLWLSGLELSPIGMPRNLEVDRLYMHGNDTVALGRHDTLGRCIWENGVNIYVHDSYCSGATYSESQGFSGDQSQGAVYQNGAGGHTDDVDHPKLQRWGYYVHPNN
jgi:hypothetical protein